VPVRRWLAPAGQRNTLSITLRPAAAETLRLKSQHPYSVPSLAQMGSVGSYIWARKPASDFGWCVCVCVCVCLCVCARGRARARARAQASVCLRASV
jgi:hypothetical protein